MSDKSELRPDASATLDAVRRDIDRIDADLLDLIGRRFAAVERVRQMKNAGAASAGTAMRPAREARVIRRLVETRPRGVPAVLVVRLWRELIAAATVAQASMRVHVLSEWDRPRNRDLVRFHYGATMDVVAHPGVDDLLAAIWDQRRDVAVVPFDDCGAGGPARSAAECLRYLFDRDGGPEIVACLPFLARTVSPEALVVGWAPREDSGDESTIVMAAHRSGDALGIFGDHGLTPVALHALEGGSNATAVAIVNGHVTAGDPRIDRLAADPRVVAARIVGSYANPIVLKEDR